MAPTITLYTQPSCPGCFATKKHLENNGYPYTEANAQSEENLAYIKSLGHTKAPVVTITDEGGNILEHWQEARPDLWATKLPATGLKGTAFTEHKIAS